MSSQIGLLKARRFLPLFVSQFLGAFNDNAFKNALVILMTYRAAGKVGVDPRLLVTAAAGVFILPFFLFSATAGQLADRFAKSRMIAVVRFLEIPVILFAILGFWLENYWMLLGVLFCAGAQAAFFGPLKYSILPELLEEGELIGGNALVEAGTFLAILLGTIVGGVLVLKSGGIAMVSAILLAGSVGGWLASLKIPATAARAAAVPVSFNFIAETWRQLRHAAGEVDVFLSIAGISWFWLVGFTFLAQFPVYASGVLGADEGVVTLFLTVFSVGIALGSLLCGRLAKGQVSGAHVPLGAFGMTAFIFLFWLASPGAAAHEGLIGVSQFIAAPAGWGILASLLGVAVAGGVYIVPLYTIMQTRCDPAHRSRTIAANNIMNALFMTLGAVLTMLLLKAGAGVTGIFLLVGIVNIPVAFLVKRIVRERRKARGGE